MKTMRLAGIALMISLFSGLVMAQYHPDFDNVKAPRKRPVTSAREAASGMATGKSKPKSKPKRRHHKSKPTVTKPTPKSPR